MSVTVRLSSILLGVVLLIAGFETYAGLPYTRPDNAIPPVFSVEIRESEDSEYRRAGTAFLIDERGYFFTASHIFPGPESEAYSGQIQLVRKVRGIDASVTISDVKEIHFKESSSDPDISILKSENPIDSKKVGAVFELANPKDNELWGRQLVAVGYPISGATKDLNWEWSSNLRIRLIDHVDFPAYYAEYNTLYSGHSGSPLMQYDMNHPDGAPRDLIVHAVFYGTIDWLDSKRKELCIANEVDFHHLAGICELHFQNFIKAAKERHGMLFSRIDALVPPFVWGGKIGSTRVDELMMGLDKNPLDVSDDLLTSFDHDPITTLEVAALLAALNQKGKDYLSRLTQNSGLAELARITSQYKKTRRASPLDIYRQIDWEAKK